MLPCPICKRPAAARAQNSAFPFCTPRCKQIDLGGWFDESYRVPLTDTESSDEAISEEGS